jgi:hypothetical protein
MKIAFYIDPFISPISTFYTLILLQQELLQHNHTLIFHIPYAQSTTTNNDDCYVNNIFATHHNYNIIWDFPNENEYDILLLTHIWSKKWNKRIDTRKIIADRFIKLQKKVISLKVDTTLEHRHINNRVIYGVNSSFRINLSDHWMIPDSAKQFIFHQISNYKFEKPNHLNKESFFQKYNLNQNKQIITFFMSRYKKWYNSKLDFALPIFWFFRNLKKITKVLHKLNYQLVFKLHRSDGTAIIDKYNLDNLTIIDNYDTYELIKYSSRALSFGTSMVYELYLYNLPVMEIGNGIYYPGWLSYVSRTLQLKSPLKKYDNGRQLIYGTIIPYKMLSLNFNNVMKKFIDTEYNIDKYKYKNKHPIYGNSYNATIQSITTQLIDQFK